MNNNNISTKTDYISRLAYLDNILQSENVSETKALQRNEKFIKYINWLKENGAVFEDNLHYPIAYGPSGLVGVKAKRSIDNNEAILYIPKRLMIISKEHESKYVIKEKVTKDKGNKNDDEEPSIIDEDNSSINLTIFLIEQKYKEGDNSFYKPYLDLFPEQDFSIFWSDEKFKELDCDSLVNSIKTLTDEIITEYNQLAIEFKNQYSVETFMMFYSHVLSRQFYINEDTSALIPMTDALNHSASKIKYEIFDSENFICKYTEHFSHFKNIKSTKNDMFYHYINQQLNNSDTNHNSHIDSNNHTYVLKNTNDIDVLLENTDYFII